MWFAMLKGNSDLDFSPKFLSSKRAKPNQTKQKDSAPLVPFYF